MMKPADKSKLTRVKNSFERWNEKYLTDPSPYIIDKYRQAVKKYNRVTEELKQKYKGTQTQIQL